MFTSTPEYAHYAENALRGVANFITARQNGITVDLDNLFNVIGEDLHYTHPEYYMIPDILYISDAGIMYAVQLRSSSEDIIISELRITEKQVIHMHPIIHEIPEFSSLPYQSPMDISTIINVVLDDEGSRACLKRPIDASKAKMIAEMCDGTTRYMRATMIDQWYMYFINTDILADAYKHLEFVNGKGTYKFKDHK